MQKEAEARTVPVSGGGIPDVLESQRYDGRPEVAADQQLKKGPNQQVD